jgi:tetratricopeptide (TPR) repeat protein
LLDNKIPSINTPVFTLGCQPNKQHAHPQLEPVQQGTVSDPKRADAGMLLIEALLPIKKGNSGGPLLLDDQHVVGILNGYDENQPALSVSLPATVLIQLMAQQQLIAFEPEITTLWQKAQESRDKAEQLKLYDEILNKTPWHTEAHFNQGIIYFTQHNYLTAKEHFQFATQQRPNFYNAYIYLGLTLSELKDYTAARDNLIQAILLDAKNPLAYSLIAGVYQNGLGDSLSERNALQQYVKVETTQSKADIAKRRLQEIEQSFKP